MSENLFALNWSSSINNQCLPDDGIEYKYEDLFVFHIKNLVDNLIKSASWVPVSCSYYDTASQTYKLATPVQISATGSMWITKENLKFADCMVTGSSLKSDGTINYDLIKENNGLYTASNHPWIMLRHTRSLDSYGESNNYMIIDCRYPLPPHVSDLGFLYNNQGESINDYEINSKAKLLGAGEMRKKQYTINKSITHKKKTKIVDIAVEAYPLDHEFNAFQGLTKRDESILNSNLSLESEIIQDYNARSVSFVDIVYMSSKPEFEGSLNCRPISNKINNIIDNDSFDNRAVYTCWGYDSINPGKSAKGELSKEFDKYHFHYDEGTGVFIYQLTNKDIGRSNFSSMCGLVKVANAHEKDKFPYTTLTLNVDPDYDQNTICYNNPTGKLITIVTGSTQTNYFNNFLETSEKYKNDFMNTFYNTLYRNYNFSDGIGAKRYGNTKNINDKTDLPVFAPIDPKHSSLFIREQESPKVKIKSDSPDIPNPLSASKAARLTTSKTSESDKISFSTVSNPLPQINLSNGPYGNSGQYLVSFEAEPNTTAYDVYVYVDGENDKKLLSNKSLGNYTTLKLTIDKAKTSLLINGNQIPDNTVINYFNNSNTSINTGNIIEELSDTWGDIKQKMGDNFIACNDPTSTLVPQAITASLSNDNTSQISVQSVSTSSFKSKIIEEGGIKYARFFVGLQNGYFNGGVQVTEPISLGSLSKFTFDLDYQTSEYFKQQKSSGDLSPTDYNTSRLSVETKYLIALNEYINSNKNQEAKELISINSSGYKLFNDSTENRNLTCQIKNNNTLELNIDRGSGTILKMSTTTVPTFSAYNSDSKFKNIAVKAGIIINNGNISNLTVLNRTFVALLLSKSADEYSAKYSITSDEAIEWYKNCYLASMSARGSKIINQRLPATNMPCYIKVPLGSLYEPGKYLEEAKELVAYNLTSSAGFADVWKPTQNLKNPQLNGSNAFTVFKSLSSYGDTQLVALNYSLNEDLEKPLTNSSVFGLTVNNESISSDEKKILLSNGTKNTSDATYSEMPIFLLSLNPNAPELKGYVSDLFWGPSGITNGSMVVTPGYLDSTNPNKKVYSKIYWNGWWLPWVADETPDWG